MAPAATNLTQVCEDFTVFLQVIRAASTGGIVHTWL
jgi:hypothetical protein